MISTPDFLNLLAGSNVVTPDVVDKLRRRVDEARSPVEAARVAQRLVDRGDITAWQARQLLAGRNAFYLGRYQLLERIGAGGMGIVFKARHAVMDRTVAIKVMARELLNRPTAVARFNREVKAAAALNHPNIIAAYDADCVGNTHFLVMEFVEGRDLNYWLRTAGQMPISTACECAMQACEGLQHAYRQGMVHRDIKPVNLLVQWSKEQERPFVKILDMGLARFASEAGDEASLTRAGQTIGTPDYIAPEAADNFRQADIRADIFSTGCTLFRLLTGKLPYPGTSTLQKLLARAKDDAPLVSTLRPDVPPALDAVVAKMMARAPEERYQTPAEVAAALAPFAASRTGDRAALDFLRDPPGDPATVADQLVEGDADTSLEEFFRDFSLMPLRENHDSDSPQQSMPPKKDNARPQKPPAMQEEIGLADDLTPAPGPPAAKPAPAPKAPPAAKPAPKPAAAAAKTQSPKKSAPAAPQTKTAPAKKPASSEPAPMARLDDLLSDDALLGPSGGIDLNEPAVPDEPEPEKKPAGGFKLGGRRKKRGLDSPFLLYGGGTLLLLAITLVALYFSLNRGTAEKSLAAADGLYNMGNDADAIEKYDAFLKQYPSNPAASLARVHQGIAKMRFAIATNRNWEANVKTCEDTLKEISKEKDYKAAAADVATVLTKLSEQLTRVAELEKRPELIALARQTLALAAIDDYVPKDLKPVQKLADLEAETFRIEENLGRDAALAAALTGINEAVAAGKVPEAFALRRDLLKRYPALETDPKLQEAVLSISAAQQKAVTVSNDAQPPAPDASNDVATMALVEQSGAAVAGLDGRVFAALADGAVWAVDAASGQLYWRRWVGASATAPPLPVGRQPGDDLLVLNAARNEVERVGARDGATKWRSATGGALVGQALIGPQTAIVATQPGELRWIDLAAGGSPRQVKLPQELATGPATDARNKRLYQLASHSSMYTLDAADGTCVEVLYLGYEQGSVVLPPLVVSRYLIISENYRATDARLRVLLVDEDGLKAQQVQQIDLQGRLFTQPVVAGRNLHVVTDRGTWYSYEIAQPGEGDALKVVIERAPAKGDAMVRFPVVRGSEAWVADQQIARYDLQTPSHRLVPHGVSHQGETFVQSPEIAGEYMLHVRRSSQPAGIVISASQLADGKPAWETRVASPPASAPWATANNAGLEVLRDDGRLYGIDAAALARDGIANKPVASLELAHPPASPASSIDLAGVRVIEADADGTQLAIRRATGEPALAWLKLADPLGGPILAAGDGIVAPGRNGQVRVLNPDNGGAVAQPFQPPLEPGVEYRWQGAALSDGRIVMSDSQSKLYLLEVRGTPPQLSVVVDAELAEPLRSPLAAVGQTVYGVIGGGRVQAWNAADLQAGDQVPLAGDAVWGPVAAGPVVLVAAADDQLVALGESGQQKWQVPLTHGRPAGSPLAGDSSLTIVSAGGVVQSLDAADGQSRGEIDLGQPIVSGPLALGDRLVFIAADGTVVSAPRP